MKYLYEFASYINDMLIKAVVANDYDDVVYFIKKGADVHYKNDLALVTSVKFAKKDDRVMNFLLEKGATPTGEVLAVCVQTNNFPLLKYYFDQGVTRDEGHLNDTSKFRVSPGDTLVALATSFGDLKMLKYLIEEKGLWSENVKPQYLLAPIYKNRLSIAKYLCEYDSSCVQSYHLVNAINEVTSHHCRSRTFEIAKLLNKYVTLNNEEVKECFHKTWWPDRIKQIIDGETCEERFYDFMVNTFPEYWMDGRFSMRTYIQTKRPDLLDKYKYLDRSNKAGLLDAKVKGDR